MVNSKIKRMISQYYMANDRLASIEDYFRDDPERLMDELGIDMACQGTYLCNKCNSGRGRNGTGMFPHITGDGHLRFHCFACDNSFRPVEGTLSVHPNMSFSEALDFIMGIYSPGYSSGNVRRPRSRVSSYQVAKPAPPLVADDRLMATLNAAVNYRIKCHSWQQKMSDALGLPFEALSRHDIGKAFVDGDGLNPDAGDLVMFNLVNGSPRALKVRHVPGIGTRGLVAMLDSSANVFRFSCNPGDARTFRMAGNSGEVCFGHDFVTDAVSTVVITEGQSDVLAVCAAALLGGRADITAIGRDSASHVLKPIDLDALAGKSVIYCEDADEAGRSKTHDNISLLKAHGCKVATWCAAAHACKDARDVYRSLGHLGLLNSILNNSNHHD